MQITSPFAGAVQGATQAKVPSGDAGMEKAAKAFEAIFLRQMISSMRTASLGEDILGSSASDQFRDMADARTAESMAETGGLGIAELLLKQFEATRSLPAVPATAANPAKDDKL